MTSISSDSSNDRSSRRQAYHFVRNALLAFLCAGATALADRSAHAQAPAPTTATFLPPGLVIDGVHEGAWIEYELRGEPQPPVQRQRLTVLRAADATVLMEVATRSGRGAVASTIEVEAAKDATGKWLVKSRRIRVGSAPPRTLPPIAGLELTRPLGSSELAGEDRLSVRGRGVTAKRYDVAIPSDNKRLNVWLAPGETPFAVVGYRESRGDRTLTYTLVGRSEPPVRR